MNTSAESRAGIHLPALLLTALGVALALLLAAAPAARAADGLDSAAAALRQGPVHVDPRAADRLPAERAAAVADTIERSDTPVFVAVLPDAEEFDPATLFQDLRTKVGITGVYVVTLGDRFAARADSSVMSQDEVANLAGAVQRSDPGDVPAMIDGFVDQAVRQADGAAPASWNGGSGADGTATTGAGSVVALAVMLGLLVLVTGAALVSGRRRTQRRVAEQREQLETLRPLVDEDITAFGEKLDRIGFDPSAPGTDDAMREDYTRALDAYDKAKDAMAAARHPSDVRGVTEALEEGRYALAALEARRAGGPLPERRAPCFFDPRHGPSVQDVRWAPPGGTERTVPACAADAVRIADGEEPMAREVETASGRRPYWEAGPAYGPWAYGYFGGALLPGLLMGTMLGGMLGGPGAYGHGYGVGGGGEYAGGAESGSDFDTGDFGGFGGGDFGGFGGGDFGGGF